MMEGLFAILFFALYILANLSIGITLQTLIFSGTDNIKNNSPLLNLSLAFLMGISVLPVLWTVLGLAGIFSSAYVLACLLLTLPLMLLHKNYLKYYLPDVKYLPILFKSISGTWKIVILFLFLVIILELLAAFIKAPFGDAEAYYMTYPKLLAYSDKLIAMPGIYHQFSTMGIISELHYAAIMKCASFHYAKFFVVFPGAASLILIAFFCKSLNCGYKGILTAIVMLLTSTTFSFFLSDGKTELLALAPALAAFYLIYSGGKQNFSRNIIAAAIFAGTAIVIKISYLASFMPAILLFIGLISFKREKSLSNLFKNYILFGIFVFAACIPLIIKNIILFGEPLAPLIYFNADNSITTQQWFDSGTTLKIILTYPLALIFGKYPMQGGNLSILFLFLLPFAIIKFKSIASGHRKYFYLILCAVLGLILYIIFYPSVFSPRYFLPVIIILIPVFAYATEQFLSSMKSSRFANMLIILGLTGALLTSFVKERNLLSYFVSDSKIVQSPYYEAFKEFNSITDSDDRIYFHCYYGWWLKDELLANMNSAEDEEKLFTRPDDFLNNLKKHKFKYLIVDCSIDNENSFFRKLVRTNQELKKYLIKDMFIKDFDIEIIISAMDDPVFTSQKALHNRPSGLDYSTYINILKGPDEGKLRLIDSLTLPYRLKIYSISE